MAEEANLNTGNLGNQVFSGIVQFAVPSLGWAFVTPVAANSADKGLICRLQGVGGLYGGGVWDCPPPGTLVTVRRQKNTDVAYIMQKNNQGTQQETFASVARLRQNQTVPCVSSMQFIKKLLQRIQKVDSKQKATFTGALQDQYAGDTVIGDKHGPTAFFGRAQMSLKGSDLSYIQMDATKDKITTVTVESQLDTFSDKNTITTNLNKTLKASGDFQGMGGRGWEKDPIFQQDKKLYVKYKNDIKDPVFRFQQFNGGAARGYHTTIICPLKEKQSQQPVVMSQMNTYAGEHLKLSTRSNTFIKTPFTTGLVQKHFLFAEDAKTEAKNLAQKFKKTALSDNGIQRALQLDAVIQSDTRKLLYDMLGTAATQIIGQDVDPSTPPFGKDLPWQGNQKPSVSDIIGDYPVLQTRDELLGTTTKRFKNTSFISQDPDGTITLKDGWGSQITMSHGNIYISSALDTFIRPGRDLIHLVPGNIAVSANKEIELAAKQNINIGTQQSLVLASAIGGKEGYTVLENRTKSTGDNTGMVIRSNGKLTVTASDDMHIGINDKRTQNKEDKATQGKGSVFIQGQRVRVESKGQLRLLGGYTGLYACGNDSGCGIQITTGDVTMVSPIVNMDTGGLQIGKFATTYTLQVGPNKRSVTLKKGSDTLVVHVRGDLQCRDITSAGMLIASGSCIASDYIVLQTTAQKTIPGTKMSTIRKLRAQLSKLFKTPLKFFPSNYAQPFQSWYNDRYICSKQLTFSDFWTTTDIPSMCWQNSKNADGQVLKPICVTATGKDKQTFAYPGKKAWQTGNLLTVQGDTCNIKKIKLKGNYPTYAKKGK